MFIFACENTNKSSIMKKEVIKIILKVLIYALGLVAAYFGVSACVSCTVNRTVSSQGRAVIVTTDTTVINHDGIIKFPKK